MPPAKPAEARYLPLWFNQRSAARVSVAPFLRPRSIALVGASDTPGSIGALLLANLLASGFTGPCTRST